MRYQLKFLQSFTAKVLGVWFEPDKNREKRREAFIPQEVLVAMMYSRTLKPHNKRHSLRLVYLFALNWILFPVASLQEWSVKGAERRLQKLRGIVHGLVTCDTRKPHQRWRKNELNNTIMCISRLNGLLIKP